MSQLSPRRRLEVLAIAAMVVSTVVHATLIGEHLEEMPVLGVLFILATVAGVVVSVGGVMNARLWRPAAALLFAALIAGYILTRVAGIDDWDMMGLSDKGFEVFGLMALVVSSPRVSARAARTTGNPRPGADALSAAGVRSAAPPLI